MALVLLASHGCRKGGRGPATAVVHGKVVDVDGKVVGGATVRLPGAVPGGIPVAETKGLPDGTFRIERVPAGRYDLEVEHPAFAPARVPLAAQPDEDVGIVVRLERSLALDGRVEDKRGRPVPAALVLVWQAGVERALAREVTTDETGAFQVPGLARGVYSLLVEGPGMGAIQIARVTLPARALVARLDEEGRTVRGVVERGDGGGVAGARVVLAGAGLRAPRIGTTDERGGFTFAGLGPGSYSVRAATEALASPSQVVQVTSGGDAEADGGRKTRLVLAPGAAITGRVIDEKGKALVGVEVDAQTVPADDCPELARTDVVGYFSLGPLANGRYVVGARAPGYVSSGPVSVQLGGRPATVELRVQRAASVTGRVLDHQGRPLANAVVSIGAVHVGVGRAVPVLTGALPLAAEAAQLAPGIPARVGRARSALTDGDGRYALAEVASGSVRLEIAHPDALPYVEDRLTLEPGQTRALADVRLSPGVLVEGRVLDDAGAPLEGAKVTARRGASKPAELAHAVTTTTAAEGRFSLRLPEGRYALHAYAEGRVSEALPVLDVASGRALPPLEFNLRPGRVVVQGIVRDARGRPLAGATVAAREDASHVELARAVTGSSGRFRLPGLPGGGVALHVRHPDWPSVVLAARSGGEVVVTMPLPGGLEGEVREKGSGRFVAGASVRALDADGAAGGTVRMLGAGFQIAGLAPGPWKLRAEAPGYEPVERTIDVPPAPNPRTPSVRDVLIELGRASRTASRTTPAGRP